VKRLFGFDFFQSNKNYLNFSVPLHVTPSFSTEMVTLKWRYVNNYSNTFLESKTYFWHIFFKRLHFEFVTTNKAISWKAEDFADGEWQPPRDVSIETMVWDFPITVYCSFFPGLSIGGRSEAASIRLWAISSWFSYCSREIEGDNAQILVRFSLKCVIFIGDVEVIAVILYSYAMPLIRSNCTYILDTIKLP